MVRGDKQDLSIKVDEGAKLGLITQGATRIYRQAGRLRLGGQEQQQQQALPSCQATLHAKVGKDAVLVVAPDPLVPFSRSSFVQRQRFDLEPDASLLLVDWFGAGRVNSGERWDFDLLSSRCDLFHSSAGAGGEDCGKDNVPFLIESLSMDNRRQTRLSDMPDSSTLDPFGFDVSSDATFDAFASVIMHGPAMEEVSARFEELSRSLASEHTRIRDVGRHHLDETAAQQLMQHDLHLGGRVLLGFSRAEPYGCAGTASEGNTYVARIAGTSNEDLYRVLNSCLRPLKKDFGVEFYRDRIHGSTSHKQSSNGFTAAVDAAQPRTSKRSEDHGVAAPIPAAGNTSPPFSDHASWCALMLADSGLPTGSFAHSAGIESASQLGLFGGPSAADQKRVARYINAAARSSVQFLVPFVTAGNAVARAQHRTRETSGSAIDVDEVLQQWRTLDQFSHAAMAANRPGCKASLDQGHGMLRVAMQWLGSSASEDSSKFVELANRIQQEIDKSSDGTGHFGPIFGLVCGFLELDDKTMCQVLGYCTARDMISAAVRLNLVGPMAGVNLLDGAYKAVEDGIESGSFEIGVNDDVISAAMEAVATCSPVMDAVHPSHDVLAVRLFRT